MELGPEDLYDLVHEAVLDALRKENGGEDVSLARRMNGGKVIFEDAQGRPVKETDAVVFFKKVTSVREKLRVLEQKLNNHPSLSQEDKAELQVYLTRAYGSLTTFNFLFADKSDQFQGSGS